MNKSKRQTLKEIKEKKAKGSPKMALKKIAASLMVLTLTMINVPTGFTVATFVDTEKSQTNAMSAGTLDAQMTAVADFDPAVKPSVEATKEIDLSSLGTLGFKYNIKSGNLSGDLCSNLNLKADLDGANQYNGPIEDFNIDITDFSAPEKWHFQASLETEDYSLQGKSCNLDFLVLAKQKDLVSGVGFSDDEIMANVINAGNWTIKGVWIQTTVADFNAGVSSDSGWPSYRKEISVSYPGDASLAAGGEVPPQTASFSGNQDNTHVPANAIDGDTSTFWKATQASNSDWFGVDYGQLYPVAKIEIDFHHPHIPKKYRIEISPTCAYTGEQTVVKSSTNNISSFLTIEFSETMIKCARIVFLDTSGNPAIDEFTSFKRELPWFDGSATLTSQTFDSAKITKWTKLEWDETLVSGTNINFSIQTSNDGSTWGSWQLKSGTSPIDLASLPQTRYIRWQTELTSDTHFPPISTPVLHEARVYYEQENAQNQIVMNEFLPNPDGTTWGSDTSLKPKGEWIEIYNKSASKIDVAGFYFKNSSDGLRTINAARTNTGSTVIAPNDWLVIYTGQSGSPEFMNNAGDTLTFYDLFGNIIDQHSYDLTNACNLTPTPDNPNGSVPSGSCTSVPGNKSYARIPDGTGAWVDPIPTPGTANIEEEPFLGKLAETLTSTLSVEPQIAGEATTTPEMPPEETTTTTEEITTTTQTTTEPVIEEEITTSTQTTTEPIVESTTTTDLVVEEPVATTTEISAPETATTTDSSSTSTAGMPEIETPVQQQPADTTQPVEQTQQSPAPEEPADIPEEQPAIIEEPAIIPEEPAPETSASAESSGETMPAESAPNETPII